MYKNYRYVNAGTNEFHRWGKKAQKKLAAFLEPNANGFYAIPADGGKYWTFGTSEGKFGVYARYGNVCFSVNKGGYLWAKVGTDKAAVFVSMIEDLLSEMKMMCKGDEEEDDE